MPTILKVSLDKSVSPFVVVVDEKDKVNHIPRDKHPQDVVWKLAGNATEAHFVDLEGPEPGFEWLTPPPDGIFSDLRVTDNGGKLKLHDLNADDKSVGEWIYRLRLRYKGAIYHSGELDLGGTIRDPVIVNR